MSSENKQKEPTVEELIHDLQGNKVDKKNDALKNLRKLANDEKVKKAFKEVCENDKEHPQFRINVMKALTSGEKTPGDVVEMLSRLTKNKDSLIRRQAVIGLSDVGGKKVLSYLNEALKDESHWVRLFAVRGIKKVIDLKSPSAEGLTGLVSALGDENEEVRKTALEIIEHIGNPAVKELIKQSREGNKVLKAAATGILGRLNIEEANNYLIQCLESGNDTIVRISIKYLGDNKYLKATSKLLELAKNKPDFRENIEIALFKFGFAGIPALIEGLAHYPEIKEFIFGLLKKFLPNGEQEIEKSIKKAPKEMQSELEKLLKENA